MRTPVASSRRTPALATMPDTKDLIPCITCSPVSFTFCASLVSMSVCSAVSACALLCASVSMFACKPMSACCLLPISVASPEALICACAVLASMSVLFATRSAKACVKSASVSLISLASAAMSAAKACATVWPTGRLLTIESICACNAALIATSLVST